MSISAATDDPDYAAWRHALRIEACSVDYGLPAVPAGGDADQRPAETQCRADPC